MSAGQKATPSYPSPEKILARLQDVNAVVNAMGDYLHAKAQAAEDVEEMTEVAPKIEITVTDAYAILNVFQFIACNAAPLGEALKPHQDGYLETMWATMKPDLYGGKTCDEFAPQWSCYADGDKDGEEGLAALELAARTFPPGTKVVVSEPVCPECDEPREPKFPAPTEGLIYAGPCRCGFDWDSWVESRFS